MSIAETQKRKKNNSELGSEQEEEDKYKTKMPSQSIMNKLGKLNIKKIFLTVIVFIVFIKLWQLFSNTPTSRESAPPDAKSELPKWRYKNNPQGVSKATLNRLLTTMQAGEDLWFSRPEDETENRRSKIARETPVPKLESVYKSTGSLTFQDGHFVLRGKPLRILSGAMHYFRVHPEHWEDRMDKMIACGLNTLDT